MKTLFILNDPPYGTERDFSAPRLAMTLLKREGEDVKVFLMADAAACARGIQRSIGMLPPLLIDTDAPTALIDTDAPTS